jgi:hypothetical protein
MKLQSKNQEGRVFMGDGGGVNGRIILKTLLNE